MLRQDRGPTVDQRTSMSKCSSEALKVFRVAGYVFRRLNIMLSRVFYAVRYVHLLNVSVYMASS